MAIIFPNTYTQRAYKRHLKRPVDAYETVVKGECKYTETLMDISRRAYETMFREMQRVSEKIQLVSEKNSAIQEGNNYYIYFIK